MSRYPPAGYIDAAWWEVYGARLRAGRLTREAWIDALALAYRIVRVPESLTPRQLEAQKDMMDRLLGRKFLTMEGYRWERKSTSRRSGHRPGSVR